MPREVLVVDSRAALLELDRSSRRGLSRRYRSLKFSLPQLSPEENAATEHRLNKLYLACGCAEGMIGGLIGLGVFGAWLAVREGPLSWWDLPRGIAVLFAAITAGKLAGMWRAHYRLRAELRPLVDRVGPEAPPEGPVRCAHS